MSRKSLLKLLERAKDKVRKIEDMGRRSVYSVIKPDMTLGINLRMLAGARYLYSCMAFRAAYPTIYDIFAETCDVLMETLSLSDLLRTKRGLLGLGNKFKTCRSKANILSGFAGVTDRISIKFKKPDDHKLPTAHHCRKGYSVYKRLLPLLTDF